MQGDNFQQLEEPLLIELNNENRFVIVTEVDYSEIKNMFVFMRGISYCYDDGKVSEEGRVWIQYSLTEDAILPIDEDDA